jgi:hypothetical protein
LKGAERREILEAVQNKMQEAVIEALRPLFSTFFREEVTAKLGRAKGATRQIGSHSNL